MNFATMKNLTRLLVMTAMLGATSQSIAAGVDQKTTFEDVKKETRELIQSLRAYTVDQRSKAIQEVELAILRLDSRIEDLESRIDSEWNDMSESARQEARQSLRDLRRQRVKLAEWMGSLKVSTGNAWSDIETGFSKAYEDINRSWEKALREFDDERKDGT